MATTKKITRHHPANELLGDALRSVRKVRDYLKPNMVLTHRDVEKLRKVSNEITKTRNLAIYRARQLGYTVKEVAEMFELTTAKVNQIVKAHPNSASRKGE